MGNVTDKKAEEKVAEKTTPDLITDLVRDETQRAFQKSAIVADLDKPTSDDDKQMTFSAQEFKQMLRTTVGDRFTEDEIEALASSLKPSRTHVQSNPTPVE